MTLSNLLSSLTEDGSRFLNLARDCQRKGEKVLLDTYCRAVFFTSWSALDGWIKYISYSFLEIDPSLTEFEKAFLTEKKIDVNDNGEIEIFNTDHYKPSLLKLQYIFKKFGDYDLKHLEPDIWRNLNEIQSKRNLLVHPKTRDEDLVINYDSAENCYNTINEVISLFKTKIFK